MKVIISYFLMPQKCLSKNSEIQDYALCLGNFSKDFIINNMTKKQDKIISCKIFFY